MPFDVDFSRTDMQLQQYGTMQVGPIFVLFGRLLIFWAVLGLLKAILDCFGEFLAIAYQACLKAVLSLLGPGAPSGVEPSRPLGPSGGPLGPPTNVTIQAPQCQGT